MGILIVGCIVLLVGLITTVYKFINTEDNSKAAIPIIYFYWGFLALVLIISGAMDVKEKRGYSSKIFKVRIEIKNQKDYILTDTIHLKSQSMDTIYYFTHKIK